MSQLVLLRRSAPQANVDRSVDPSEWKLDALAGKMVQYCCLLEGKRRWLSSACILSFTSCSTVVLLLLNCAPANMVQHCCLLEGARCSLPPAFHLSSSCRFFKRDCVGLRACKHSLRSMASCYLPTVKTAARTVTEAIVLTAPRRPDGRAAVRGRQGRLRGAAPHAAIHGGRRVLQVRPGAVEIAPCWRMLLLIAWWSHFMTGTRLRQVQHFQLGGHITTMNSGGHITACRGGLQP